MKLKQILLAISFAFATTYVQAQVKVGSNPGTIGSSSNLEVEATNGNKTIVDKATGQVTIVDGTQAANYILMSDANGKASWKDPRNSLVVWENVPLTDVSAFDSTCQYRATAPGWGILYFNVTTAAQTQTVTVFAPNSLVYVNAIPSNNKGFMTWRDLLNGQNSSGNVITKFEKYCPK